MVRSTKRPSGAGSDERRLYSQATLSRDRFFFCILLKMEPKLCERAGDWGGFIHEVKYEFSENNCVGDYVPFGKMVSALGFHQGLE